MKTYQIGEYKCDLIGGVGQKIDTLTYMIYPGIEPLPGDWLGRMASESGGAIAVVYVPAPLWNDSLTPWPEPGETPDAPPFGGKAQEFLQELEQKIIPALESRLERGEGFKRNLIGVSLSGLFALWQWMQSDTFTSIACLSGSFWYAGFIEWFDAMPVPEKQGRAYFLLGRKEPEAHVRAFRCVGENTQMIVERLRSSGIPVEFEWVAGDHFSDPLGRARLAFKNLYKASE